MPADGVALQPMEESAGLSDREGSMSARRRLRQTWVFALNFIKHPRMVGTFAVSSPALVRRLLGGVDWSTRRRIVEFGPGVGTITGAVLKAMSADARLLAIEMNTDFVRELAARFPDPRLDIVNGSASDLARDMARRGWPAADLVISGIPFSTMPAGVRDGILDAVAGSLAPDGQFLVYQYANHILAPLRARFEVVERETEWRNLVPVRLFRCSRPRTVSGETERVAPSS